MSRPVRAISIFATGAILGFILSLQFSAQASKSPLPLAELQDFTTVFDIIKEDYVTPVKDKELITSAISGMVSSLDPHSTYYDEKGMKDFREGTQGTFVGLGLEVTMEDGLVKVVSPIEDSPAFRAGLQSNDLISRIDQTPVRGMTLDEAVKRMRGTPGSKVTITVLRQDAKVPLIITLTREAIKVQSVKSKLIEPGYAWLRIAQFQEPTLAEMVKRLNTMAQESKTPLKGLVLDLRNDPGGLLQSAIGVSSAFLPEGKVVTSTKGQTKSSQATYYAKPEFYSLGDGNPLSNLDPLYKTLPMVVLINSGSASASEIVAGALQDHSRATIMGNTSFGKGSVQTFRPLSTNAGLKITIAYYYTPKGNSIQAKGIVPDLFVDERADGKNFESLQYREADLNNHLVNPKDAKEDQTKRKDLEDSASLLAEAKDLKPIVPGSADDFALQQGINQLKGLKVKTSEKMKAANQKAAAEKAKDDNPNSEGKQTPATKPKDK